MNSFKLKGAPLKANPLFMDIHKGKQDTKRGNETVFSNYQSYEDKIGLLFHDLPYKHRFWTNEGKTLSGMKELYAALDTMPDSTFFHHVRNGENHFAEWVENVYHDRALALKIRKATTREQAKRAIESRIDSLIDDHKQTDDQSFLKALILKLNKKNKQLEDELAVKKEWLSKKQASLEKWEQRNESNEGLIEKKYAQLLKKEHELKQKMASMEKDETSLKKAITSERLKIEHQNLNIETEKKQIEKLKDQLLTEKKKVNEDSSAIENERKRIESEKTQIQKTKDVHMSAIMQRKHEPIYNRLDELLSLAVACMSNKNYKDVREALAKIRYYYDSLPEGDSRKKEFYEKILKIKKQIHEHMAM